MQCVAFELLNTKPCVRRLLVKTVTYLKRFATAMFHLGLLHANPVGHLLDARANDLAQENE